MYVASRRSRRGFTLIELMMVIVIIGLLAGLGTRAAYQALQAAKRAAIIAEIAQLDQALSDYKTKANAFPPCMGDVDPAARQNRFYYHITKAFPNYFVGDLNSDTKRNYLDMRQQILINFQGTAGGYLDLDMMDQAEALVFWLSGFPTPKSGNSATGNLLGSSKLFGFCSSASFPFYDRPGNPFGVFTAANSGVLTGIDRTVPGFAFDESRLVDQDQDGWWEYIPMGTTSSALIPPYVYFDSDLYVAQANASASATVPYKYYPSPVAPMAGPANNASVATWGIALPYAAALPPTATTQLTWINPRKFQIISAGLDNKYGLMGAAVTNYPNLPKIFPTGLRYDMTGADNDNLTNFSDGRQLGDAQ